MSRLMNIQKISSPIFSVREVFSENWFSERTIWEYDHSLPSNSSPHFSFPLRYFFSLPNPPTESKFKQNISTKLKQIKSKFAEDKQD